MGAFDSLAGDTTLSRPSKDYEWVAQGADLRLSLQAALEPGTKESKQKKGWLAHGERRSLALGVDKLHEFNANEIFSMGNPSHQSSFSPNCTCRDVVDVLVMAPAVPESPVGFAAVGGVKTMRFGVLKLARFSRLKISARN